MMQNVAYDEPGKWSAGVLAVLMHALLATALVFSVNWQTKPRPVVAEIWTPESLALQAEPEPAPVETPKPPPPPVEIQKPKPTPAPPAPPPPPAPEIKLKADKKPPKEKPVEVKKEVVKPPSFAEQLAREETQMDRRKQDQARNRRLEEETRLLQQAREEQENQLRNSAREKSKADYIDRIRGKIRGNLVEPPNLRGNPVAIFSVSQLPSGEVLSIILRRSSGNPLYDDAVERAIRKSSPLPRPDDISQFSRELNLTFCPDENTGCPR